MMAILGVSGSQQAENTLNPHLNGVIAKSLDARQDVLLKLLVCGDALLRTGNPHWDVSDDRPAT